MSYQVIARKYRPQRFGDVVGQEHVTQTLANAIDRKRIAHAYLFCGPRGTGKTTIARIFAKALNCTDGPKADFDVNDPRCLEIAEGRSLDVLEIDGASNNGVEQVRELRETCRFAPASSRFKIYIIDEVHMLTPAAFNALLKTLEEPPAHVKFMFATTDPEKVLPTILSRCQRFDLRRIPAALIVQHLEAIARQEGVHVEEAALHAIARGADGGMRDAESTLDQLISFCGNDIAENDVLSMFGLVARGQILALADALVEGDAGRAFADLDALARNGKDLGRLLTDLLQHIRNLLIHQVSGGDRRLLEVSEAELEALAAQAPRLTPDATGRVLEVLTDAESRLRDAVSKKIALEVALLRAVQVRRAVSLDSVLSRLEALRDGSASVSPLPPPPASKAIAVPTPSSHVAPPAPPAPPPAVPTLSAPEPAATDEAAAATSPAAEQGLTGTWAALVRAVAQQSPFLKLYLQKAFPVSLEREVLTIGFPRNSDTPLTLVDNARNRELLAEALKSAGLKDPQVRFVKITPPEPLTTTAAGAAPAPAAPPPPQASTPTTAGSPLPAPTPPPAPPTSSAPPTGPTATAADTAGKPKPSRLTKLDPDTFKNDPRIAAAVAAFRGRIVQVVAPADAAT